MNYVQRLLHSAASNDLIRLLALQEKGDDFVWLENHGYFVRGPWGGYTEKGKAYIKKANREFLRLEAKTDRQANGDMDSPRFKEMQRKLLQHKKNGMDLLVGLTEDEAYAVRYLTKTY